MTKSSILKFTTDLFLNIFIYQHWLYLEIFCVSGFINFSFHSRRLFTTLKTWCLLSFLPGSSSLLKLLIVKYIQAIMQNKLNCQWLPYMISFSYCTICCTQLQREMGIQPMDKTRQNPSNSYIYRTSHKIRFWKR